MLLKALQAKEKNNRHRWLTKKNYCDIMYMRGKQMLASSPRIREACQSKSNIKKEGNIMNKIINFKKYDTDTAQKIASVSSGGSYTDYGYSEETLYRKKTGEFFVYVEGGAMSMCCLRAAYENCWSFSDHFVPLTLDEAKEWVMENCDGDKYESLFGPVEE